MQLYTEIITLKITKEQKDILEDLKFKKIKVSRFIRLAIKEKLQRDASELIDESKIKRCPFGGQIIN